MRSISWFIAAALLLAWPLGVRGAEPAQVKAEAALSELLLSCHAKDLKAAAGLVISADSMPKLDRLKVCDATRDRDLSQLKVTCQHLRSTLGRGPLESQRYEVERDTEPGHVWHVLWVRTLDRQTLSLAFIDLAGRFALVDMD
jgi:hypothetical protein